MVVVIVISGRTIHSQYYHLPILLNILERESFALRLRHNISILIGFVSIHTFHISNRSSPWSQLGLWLLIRTTSKQNERI